MSIQNNTLPDNPQIQVIKSGKTGLFTNYIYKAIPLAFDESMSYYETLCGLLHYLKNVIIPTLNNNANAVAELQNLYIELKSYVDDYFTNLDVQEEINNKLDAMVENGTLEKIVGDYAMKKLDYYIIDNTITSEELQTLFNIERAKVIEFKNGDYTFNNTFNLNSNTTLLLNDANITFTTNHAFFNFLPTDEFLGYNGNSNIKFVGGNFYGASMSLCHAKNIELTNVNFYNSLNDHILELAGLNNVTIKGCHFEGVINQDASRNYVEFVQIDLMTSSAFPHFNSSTNPTYDNTMNKNFLIDGNEFTKPSAPNFSHYTSLGMHDALDNLYHENITVINNKFNNPNNRGISFAGTRHVLIKNNHFYNDTYVEGYTQSRMCYFQSQNEDIIIENNVFDGNIHAIDSGVTIHLSNMVIQNNIFKNYNYSNEQAPIVYAKNPEEVSILNNIFTNNTQNHIRVETNQYANTNQKTCYIRNNFLHTPLNKVMIKVYAGDYIELTNNTLISDNVQKDYDASILINDITLKNLFYNNNMFSQNLMTQNKASNISVVSTYPNIYHKSFIAYSGSTSYSALTNQSLNSNLAFNQFNRCRLILHKSGDASQMMNVDLTGFTSQNKLEARKYPITMNIDGVTHYATFTINSDGTFDYNSDGQITLRVINLYNDLTY